MAYTFKTPDDRYTLKLVQTINHWLLTTNFGHEDDTTFTSRIEPYCGIVRMSVSAHAREYLISIPKRSFEQFITELPGILAECLCSAQEKS